MKSLLFAWTKEDGKVDGGRKARASAAVELSVEAPLGEAIAEVKQVIEVATVEGFGATRL